MISPLSTAEQGPEPEFSGSLIERIPQRPLQLTLRVNRPTTIERVGQDPFSSNYIELISDEQLLAELPSGKPAGLLRSPDGTVRLVFHYH